jgi:REP element-mobilizing transposase RayT
MGLSKREDAPDRLSHITARVNWRAWHLNDDVARRELAGLIAAAAEEFCVSILAYALMANHLHAVVKSPPPIVYRKLTGRRTPCRHWSPWPTGHQSSTVIAQFMRKIRRAMSGIRQSQLGLSGRFWEGAYDSRRISDPWGLVVRMAYDHRNPVRARIVARPEDYPWSSARFWAYGAPSPIPIDLHCCPLEMGAEELREKVLRYQASKTLDDLEAYLKSGEVDWITETGTARMREILEARDLHWPHAERGSRSAGR